MRLVVVAPITYVDAVAVSLPGTCIFSTVGVVSALPTDGTFLPLASVPCSEVIDLRSIAVFVEFTQVAVHPCACLISAVGERQASIS